MNISSIGNANQALNARPTSAEAPRPDVRQDPQLSGTPAISDQAVAQAQKTQTKKEELEAAIKDVNEFVKPFNNSLQFNLDNDTGKTVVKVIDTSTKEIIRQFPSEEMLSIAKAIDKMKGLLVHQKA